MATSNFINVDNLSYCGKEAQEIFSKSIFNLDLSKAGVTFRDNVKGKEKIYTGELKDVWQAYSCPFTPSGSAALDEAYIEPEELKVNMENCYDTFWNTYFVEQQRITLDGGLPQTFSDWFFNQRLLPQMEKEYQEMFWKGDKAYAGSTKKHLKVVDGVQTLLTKTGTKATLIDGSAITIANVVSQVEAAVLKGLEIAAQEEIDPENYKIIMNVNDVKLLEVALGKDCSCNLTNSVFKNYSKEGDTIRVMGFDVVPAMVDRNVIIFGDPRNLILGFDTFNSHLEYKLIDMKETTGDNSFRVISISNIAVAVLFPELFVVSRVKA